MLFLTLKLQALVQEESFCIRYVVSLSSINRANWFSSLKFFFSFQKSPEGKRNCHWLLTTHSNLLEEDLVSVNICIFYVFYRTSLIFQLTSLQPDNLQSSRVNIKYEPFILHCKCANIESARKLVRRTCIRFEHVFL